MDKLKLKTLRLDPKEISFISRKGFRLILPNMDLRVWRDNNLEYPLFAVSISTKIDKRATVRNKIKRKIRAVFFNLSKQGLVKKGKYVLIVKNRELLSTNIDEIKKELEPITFKTQAPN